MVTDKEPMMFQTLQPSEARTLVAVMRRIVPHEDADLRDVVLYTALAYDARLVGDLALRAEVRSEMKELDRQAQGDGLSSFADASSEEQDSILRAIEDTTFFQNLVYATVADFYNRHIVWQAIGYPGLDQRDGQGYLNRGFDAIPVWVES